MAKTGMLAIVCVVFAVLVAACSSSSGGGNGGSSCDFSGNYDVSFGAASGDSTCPDLSAQHATYTYVQNNDGTVGGTEPPDTTPASSGNTFDKSTCKAHVTFNSTKAAAAGCDASSVFTFDEAFTSSGFTGTYTFAGCGASGGQVIHVNCVYPITGTKK